MNILETMKKDRSMLDQMNSLQNNETGHGSNGKFVRSSSVSSGTMDSTATPPTSPSQTKSYNASFDTYNSSQKISSNSVSIPSAISINQFEVDNKQDDSCDDMN